MTVIQISTTELHAKIQQQAVFLLDVREPHEYKFVHIAGSQLIPLSQLSSKLSELNPQHEIVTICHHGMRSQQAAVFLAHQGFAQVFNLRGGIDAWSREVDSTLPRY